MHECIWHDLHHPIITTCTKPTYSHTLTHIHTLTHTHPSQPLSFNGIYGNGVRELYRMAPPGVHQYVFLVGEDHVTTAEDHIVKPTPKPVWLPEVCVCVCVCVTAGGGGGVGG